MLRKELSATAVANPSANQSILLQTYNIACFTSLTFNGKPIIQINKFLAPNQQRIDAIIKFILANPTDIFCFQEAWEGKTRKRLMTELQGIYPYNSGNLGEGLWWSDKWPLSEGSGCLILSRYPIVEMKFIPHMDQDVNEAILANKGFIGMKVSPDGKNFLTIYDTHLQAGNDLLPTVQNKLGGTTSARRGEELARMYEDMVTWGNKPPSNLPNLVYLKTIFAGDLNTALNNQREALSISTGMSNNGFDKGDIKYPGQHILFEKGLCFDVPVNFAEAREDVARVKGQGKQVDPERLKQAVAADKFTGTTLPDPLLIANKEGTPLTRQQTEFRVIDAAFVSQDGVTGKTESEIVMIVDEKGVATSDHFSRRMRFTFDIGAKTAVKTAKPVLIEEDDWVLVSPKKCL